MRKSNKHVHISSRHVRLHSLVGPLSWRRTAPFGDHSLPPVLTVCGLHSLEVLSHPIPYDGQLKVFVIMCTICHKLNDIALTKVLTMFTLTENHVDNYSAPNEKLPKLNFTVFGLYLFNLSYLKQGSYIFTFSKHFCVRNCGFNLISSEAHFSIITPTRNVTVSSNLC